MLAWNKILKPKIAMALGSVYNYPEGKGVVHGNLTGNNVISIGMDGSYKATTVDLELDHS